VTRASDGWVRNREDGRVEAVFEGPKSGRVDDRVVSRGSPAADVERVEADYEEPRARTGSRFATKTREG